MLKVGCTYCNITICMGIFPWENVMYVTLYPICVFAYLSVRAHVVRVRVVCTALLDMSVGYAVIMKSRNQIN